MPKIMQQINVKRTVDPKSDAVNEFTATAMHSV